MTPQWSTMTSVILSYGLLSRSGVCELSLGANTDLNCSVGTVCSLA